MCTFQRIFLPIRLSHYADNVVILAKNLKVVNSLCLLLIAFKYLGVYLGEEGTRDKNWSGVLEMVEGRVRRWSWLLSHMSYRRHTIIVHNVVVSALWHRLSCLEPPSGLLAKIQAINIDLFGDKYHWIPQSALYLSKE